MFFLLESSQAEGFIVSDKELDRTLSQIDFKSFLASQSASPPPLASTPVKKKFRVDWLQREGNRVARGVFRLQVEKRQAQDKLNKWSKNVELYVLVFPPLGVFPLTILTPHLLNYF